MTHEDWIGLALVAVLVGIPHLILWHDRRKERRSVKGASSDE